MSFIRNRVLRKSAPTAWIKRWGFFHGWVPAFALVVGGMIFLSMGGCAGSSSEDCLDPGSTNFSAPEDSLGIGEFIALEPAHRRQRRNQAEAWLERSRNAAKAGDRVRALANAAGLAPDDPEIWLRLATIWRWVGENLRTEACLDNAAAAVRNLGRRSSDFYDRSSGYKKDVALRTGLERAWLHYDRAEYNEGLDWARAAYQMEPGNALVWQILGLLEGSVGHRSQAHEAAGDLLRARGFNTDTAWILSTLDSSFGRHREAFNYFLELRPQEDHVAECWRDMGLAAERVGEWSYARRWYRESAAGLPFEDTSCLMEVTHPRLDFRLRSVQQPVWLAFGRYYVTGSRSAYTAYALERFDQASGVEERDTWAGLLVNSAGICIRLNLDTPWARRARGIVFSRTGKTDRGLKDLQRALRQLNELGVADARVEAEIGHLFLLGEKTRRAIEHLRVALGMDDQLAGAWSDLGLALIMVGETDEAGKALTRSLELDSSSATAWYNRGLMNMHSGNLDQAESDLKKAAEMAPDNQEVGRLLQQVLRRKNEGG